MTGTWEILRYPTMSTRADSEFYDEVECDRAFAEKAARALQDCYSGWWFFVKPAVGVPEATNWEETGRTVEPREEPLIVDDELQALIGYVSKTHHFRYRALESAT